MDAAKQTLHTLSPLVAFDVVKNTSTITAGKTLFSQAMILVLAKQHQAMIVNLLWSVVLEKKNPLDHAIMIADTSCTHIQPGTKTINVFRACLGAQLTICAQK